MIFSEKCYKCQNRALIEIEWHDKAKEYWAKRQSCYIFPCGACYNPTARAHEDVFQYSTYCDLDMIKEGMRAF